MKQRITHWIDRSAIGLSGLCLLHCLLGTLVLAVLSAGGSGLFGHGVHQVGLALAMPLALVGLARGVVRHGDWTVVAIGGFGIFCMVTALIIAHGAGEVGFTVVGVVLVAVAHLMNIRLLRT